MECVATHHDGLARAVVRRIVSGRVGLGPGLRPAQWPPAQKSQTAGRKYWCLGVYCMRSPPFVRGAAMSRRKRPGTSTDAAPTAVRGGLQGARGVRPIPEPVEA